VTVSDVAVEPALITTVVGGVVRVTEVSALYVTSAARVGVVKLSSTSPMQTPSIVAAVMSLVFIPGGEEEMTSMLL